MAEIEDFINKITGSNNIGIFSHSKIRLRSINEILSAVAYERMRVNGFGGTKRSIYTELVDTLNGKVAQVFATKMCVTGDYIHGGGGSGYDDDYEPAYLMNQKHHRILILDYIYEKEGFFSHMIIGII